MLRNQNAFIFVFDITRAETLNTALERYQGVQNLLGQDFKAVLVGNKSDYVEAREVTREEGEAAAERFDLQYFETCAVSGDNVRDMFQCVLDGALQNYDDR